MGTENEEGPPSGPRRTVLWGQSCSQASQPPWGWWVSWDPDTASPVCGAGCGLVLVPACPGPHSIWAGLGGLRHPPLGLVRAVCWRFTGSPQAQAQPPTPHSLPWVTLRCAVGVGGGGAVPLRPLLWREAVCGCTHCFSMTDLARGLGLPVLGTSVYEYS